MSALEIEQVWMSCYFEVLRAIIDRIPFLNQFLHLLIFATKDFYPIMV